MFHPIKVPRSVDMWVLSNANGARVRGPGNGKTASAITFGAQGGGDFGTARFRFPRWYIHSNRPVQVGPPATLKSSSPKPRHVCVLLSRMALA